MPGSRSIIRRITAGAIACSCLLIGVYSFSGLYSQANNTLDRNGRWTSTKARLGKGVVGAVAFLTTRVALQGNRLNLGAWSGFHEVIYNEKIDPRAVEFDFNLPERSYLVFIFNRDERGASAIRLSRSDLYDNAYLIVGKNGGFLGKDRITAGNIKSGGNHFKMLFGDGGFSVSINGMESYSRRMTILRPQSIGFRGGFENSFVDRLLISARNPAEDVRESFGNPRGFAEAFIPLFSLFLLMDLVLFALKKSAGLDAALFALVRLNFSLALLGTLLFAADFHYLSALYYPRFTRYYGFKNTIDPEKNILEKIDGKFHAPPAADTLRIMFIGSSQTWGAGAAADEETFVSLIEEKLNGPPRRSRRHYECVNAGIPGLKIKRLWELYEGNWLRLRPRLVVINLATNDRDTDPAAFSGYLEKFVSLNRSLGIKTLFVLEANSIQTLDAKVAEKRESMRRTASRDHIPVVDMNAYLARNDDAGFLWWDQVHLTSY